MTIMTTAPDDLITRARSGDGDAFRVLTEPHHRELQVHCYRMLGSLHDAEDALQDTLLAAWQGFSGFERRASLRTWLYRIATNRCLNALRSTRRRQAHEWDVPAVEPPAPNRLGELPWLEPFPDALLDSSPLGPDAVYERTESISLAFVTALQALPPRQLAVLILRDVLGFPAADVAGMLDTTVDSVASALKRARLNLQGRPPVEQPSTDAVVADFVRAYEAGDLGAIVAMLTDDVFITMPPIPYEYVGLDASAAFCAAVFGSGRRFDLVPTRANGQIAFGTYLRAADGSRPGVGLLVLAFSGDRVCAMNRFERSLLPAFGLPAALDPPAAPSSTSE
jgi:RNA polymerase sigma-70 factor (TIGR02960 family)